MGLRLTFLTDSAMYFELRSICGTGATLPTSYTIPSHRLDVDSEPFASGGFGDVYHGTLDGSNICIKRVRVYKDVHSRLLKCVIDPAVSPVCYHLTISQTFHQEATVWKRLTHPNVPPLLGIATPPSSLFRIRCLEGAFRSTSGRTTMRAGLNMWVPFRLPYPKLPSPVI